jgi:membrane protease YdiL (CAAX protease family)
VGEPGNGQEAHGVDLAAGEGGSTVMHPDHLPTPTAAQRTSDLLVRIALFPLLRLVWTLLLLGGVFWALSRFAPSVFQLPNVSIGGAVRNALVALMVLWVSVRALEGKTLGQAVGLTARRGPTGFTGGFALGALLLSLAIGTLALAGAYRVDGLGSGAGLEAVAHAALLFALVAVFEEVIARGILFRLLEQGLGTWAAVAISALLFGFSHRGNPGATTLSSVAIALEAGVVLGAAYVATRSLWLPIGMHTAWNLFEGPVYGAAVSGNDLPSVLSARFPGPDWLTGGTFGPEAGVPTIVLGSALGVAFLVVAIRRGQVFTPHWMLRLLGRAPPRSPPPLPSPAPAAAPAPGALA